MNYSTANLLILLFSLSLIIACNRVNDPATTADLDIETTTIDSLAIQKRSYQLGAYMKGKLFPLRVLTYPDTNTASILKGIQAGMKGEGQIFETAEYERSKKDLEWLEPDPYLYQSCTPPILPRSFFSHSCTQVSFDLGLNTQPKFIYPTTVLEFGKLAAFNKIDSTDFDVDFIKAGIEFQKLQVGLDSIDPYADLNAYFDSKKLQLRKERADQTGKELFSIGDDIQYYKLEEGTTELVDRSKSFRIMGEAYLEDGTVLFDREGFKTAQFLDQKHPIWKQLLEQMHYGDRCLFFISGYLYNELTRRSSIKVLPQDLIILDLKISSSAIHNILINEMPVNINHAVNWIR